MVRGDSRCAHFRKSLNPIACRLCQREKTERGTGSEREEGADQTSEGGELWPPGGLRELVDLARGISYIPSNRNGEGREQGLGCARNKKKLKASWETELGRCIKVMFSPCAGKLHQQRHLQCIGRGSHNEKSRKEKGWGLKGGKLRDRYCREGHY